MKRRLRSVIVALALALACGPPAESASTLVFKAVAVDGDRSEGPLGRIYAGPHGVMTLGGRGWQSVADAREVARRLNALAEEGAKPGDVAVRRAGGAYLITARGQPVVAVNRQLARVHRSAPRRLAGEWANNLKARFGSPYLSMAPVVVPVGEARSPAVLGNPSGRVEVRALTPVVSASYDSSTRTVRVVGERVGRTELVVRDRESRLAVPVRSAKYAGHLAAAVSAVVTGRPASVDAVARAVSAAVEASLELEPGAWARVSPWVGATPALQPGQSAVVPVRVSAAGEDYLTYHTRAQVSVRNDAIGAGPVQLLMVSNSPERLLSHGLWYEGTLDGVDSARLLYHHVNGTEVHSALEVEVWNLGEETARVHVLSGTGGPSPDESWAGHRAAREFLSNRARETGWVVPIPPQTAAPVLVQPMTPGATASGVAELRVLAGSGLRARLYLRPSGGRASFYPVRFYTESPFLGRWQYPDPHQQVNAHYTVGRDWAFVSIGNDALVGQVPGDRLAGNYGVIYEIELELANPTAEEVPVKLLLEPGGGPARATLLVDGRALEAAMLSRDSEAHLARYVLAPGERRHVRIETMPQGGSNYPVRLVARAG